MNSIGPKPDGELPIEQEERLREIALWMFINGESIYAVRPWVVTNENDIWFTKNKNEDTVYAFVKEKERWKYGEWKEVVLQSVQATEQTEVSVLSQNDKVLEYQPDVIPKTTWKQAPDGLRIRSMRAQRIYNDRKWPNPVVLRITNVKPALAPPRVETVRWRWDGAQAVLEGDLKDMGKAAAVEAGFEYRSIRGLDLTERIQPWRQGPFTRRTAPGEFSLPIEGWKPGDVYEFRAVVKHPLLATYGKEVRAEVK